MHPNALRMLRRSTADTTSSSSSSSSSNRVRVGGYLRWFDTNMTILMQPAELLAEEAQLLPTGKQHQQEQQEQKRRVEWLIIP